MEAGRVGRGAPRGACREDRHSAEPASAWAARPPRANRAADLKRIAQVTARDWHPLGSCNGQSAEGSGWQANCSGVLRTPAMRFALLVFLAAAPEPDALDLSALPTETDLVSVLWSRAPDLVAARARIGQASADVLRSQLLPNPTFDFQWGTLPIGPTNPPGLDRLKDVPNYSFTLGELVELGKRGPRQ